MMSLQNLWRPTPLSLGLQLNTGPAATEIPTKISTKINQDEERWEKIFLICWIIMWYSMLSKKGKWEITYSTALDWMKKPIYIYIFIEKCYLVD